MLLNNSTLGDAVLPRTPGRERIGDCWALYFFLAMLFLPI